MSRSLTDSFRLSFRLKTAYRVNTIIYGLKQIPLIKKLLPSSLYKSEGLKRFAKAVSFIWEILSSILGKIIYLAILSYTVSLMSQIGMAKCDESGAFINVFIFMTMAGGIWNTCLFEPSKDKYYAISIMRFDAREYTLSNYYYYMIKTVVFLMPFTLIFGLKSGVPLGVCILMPFFVASVKNLVNVWALNDESSKKQNRVCDIMPTPIALILTALIIFFAYALPFMGYAIGAVGFYVILGILLGMGIASMFYIHNYREYRKLCREMLQPDKVFYNAETAASAQKKSSNRKIVYDARDVVDSSKKGYDYFHDLFVKRHKGMLIKTTKIISIVIAVIFIIIFVLMVVFKNLKPEVNDIMQNMLPYFLFIMYFVNRGESITRIMFMNCDSSMLSYRFYREPKAILKLFKARIKTIVGLNLIPGGVMALGSAALLYITGGAEPIIYVLTVISILSMSVFFSVHYLVMYYILQPYNAGMEMKNPTFSIVCTATYFICFGATKIHISTMIFGFAMAGFAVIYCAAALLAVYKYAPKTFKLR